MFELHDEPKQNFGNGDLNHASGSLPAGRANNGMRRSSTLVLDALTSNVQLTLNKVERQT